MPDPLPTHDYSPFTCKEGFKPDSFVQNLRGPFSFWFHYNRPESDKKKEVVITACIDGNLLNCREVICNVPTRSLLRDIQPTFVMAGECKSYTLANGALHLSGY